MKDSYNYSGFLSTVIMTRQRKSKTKSRTIVVHSADREMGETNRFCPPYLQQPARGKIRAK